MFIVRDCCSLIVLLSIAAAVLFSVHTCVMGCGWTIYSNVFRTILTSIPVKKHPPVSASAAEAATNFKMLQFTCIGTFRRSCAHLEGMFPNKKYPSAQLYLSGSVRYDALVSARKIVSEA